MENNEDMDYGQVAEAFLDRIYKGVVYRINEDLSRGFTPNLWPIVQGTLCVSPEFRNSSPYSISKSSAELVPVIEQMLDENGVEFKINKE